MFETSFLLFLEYLLLNIIIPFIPGLFFLWIMYGDKIKGILLYLLSRFVGVGVVAFSLINIQFVHFGAGIPEYFIILGIVISVFILKIFIKNQCIEKYISTLKLKNITPELRNSFCRLSSTEKILTIISALFFIYYICITGIYNFNLPTYSWDSFWNRNWPAFNIYFDGGVKLFGDESEILGRGRLGYPIHIPVYKALISQFVGGINDIYFNTWQRLVFLFGLLFIFSITFNKTKNIFKSTLPIGLILGLPLAFFHSFEGMMDLPLTIYCIISAWLFYQYLETKDFDYISLGLLFGFILSFIKNDGFIVYFPGLLIALFIVLYLRNNFISTIKGFYEDKNNLGKSILYFVYFFVPFLIIHFVHGLGFNQSAYLESGTCSSIHSEIFMYFEGFFLEMDNYNLILIILSFIFVSVITKNKKDENNIFFVYIGLFIFYILNAVFLFTDNYRFLINQATVHRVFTMCFIIVLAFSGFLLNEE